MSGKGGVGKSAVTAMLAAGMQKRGLAVGVLDADITGPSIPRIMGVRGRVGVENGKLRPTFSAGGIKVMSANLILDREDDALIWRGPMVSNAIRQFWEDTSWEKLDYLLVDLPPGTSDAPLTVMQMLPRTDVLIVTSPQALASMIVRKAINMARRVGARRKLPLHLPQVRIQRTPPEGHPVLQQTLPRVRDSHGGRALLSPGGGSAARESFHGTHSTDASRAGRAEPPRWEKNAEGDRVSIRKDHGRKDECKE
ncbi:MAG: P-loop NTPase [Actinobacteria bacterium]|nr:P-loop NTPase [Actinomycetota bacterium]